MPRGLDCNPLKQNQENLPGGRNADWIFYQEKSNLSDVGRVYVS
jgi:hypothetical protein